MNEKDKLLVYARPGRGVTGTVGEIKRMAEKAGVYPGGVEVLTGFSFLSELLARGLPNVTRAIAIYDQTGLAISFVNELLLHGGWIGSRAVAIISVPRRQLCDNIRGSMVPEGVWVFGVGAGYDPGIDLSAFIAGKLSS